MIILPVWYEDQLIQRTIGRYRSALSKFPAFELHVVASAIERRERGGISCVDEVRDAISKESQIFIHEVEPKLQSKPFQLASFFQSHDLADNTLLLFVDIDTDIPLEDVNHETANIDSDIVQFHTLFLLNFDSVSYWQRGQAIYQSRWTICHEVRRVWVSGIVRFYASHLVGHGLLLEKSVYDAIGGFPTSSNTEDVHFGFLANQLNYRMKSAATLSASDVPKDNFGGMKQEYSWAFGPLRNFAYLADALERGAVERRLLSRLSALMSAIFGTVGFMTWLLQGPILLLTIYMSFFDQRWLIVIAIYTLDHMLAARVFTRTTQFSWYDFVLSYPSLVWNWVRRSFSALAAIVRLPFQKTGQTIKTYHD